MNYCEACHQPRGNNSNSAQELDNTIQNVDRIRTMEGQHDIKLSEKVRLQKVIKELEESGRELLLKQQESYNHELQTLDAANKKNYEEEMDKFTDAKDSELSEMIIHINTKVLFERRLMAEQDVRAQAFRELDRAWKLNSQQLDKAHSTEVRDKIKLAKQTYNAKLAEMVAHLDAGKCSCVHGTRLTTCLSPRIIYIYGMMKSH